MQGRAPVYTSPTLSEIWKRDCMGGIKHRESSDAKLSILMKIKAEINVVQQRGKREKLGLWRDHLGYKTGLGRIQKQGWGRFVH